MGLGAERPPAPRVAPAGQHPGHLRRVGWDPEHGDRLEVAVEELGARVELRDLRPRLLIGPSRAHHDLERVPRPLRVVGRLGAHGDPLERQPRQRTDAARLDVNAVPGVAQGRHERDEIVIRRLAPGDADDPAPPRLLDAREDLIDRQALARLPGGLVALGPDVAALDAAPG